MQNRLFTVLVVEDNSHEVILLEKAFKQAGTDINVRFVINGEEAVEYLSGEGQGNCPAPDLVIMDLKMPRRGGFEVLEWFRNLQEGALVPVIILTASDNEADVQRAYALGANSYFLKPAGLDQFRDLVKLVHDYWKLSKRPRIVAHKH